MNMDNKPTDYKSIRLILCMLLFPLVYSFDYSCPSFNCGDLTDRNNCVLKAKSTNNYTISFLVNECLDSDNICPFAASTNGTETKCIPRRLDKMAFPGQSCDNKNRLCFPEFTCSNKNICKGSSNWEPCFNADECNVGWTCRANETSPLPNNKICQPQLNLGDKCKSDLDCLNYMGCYEGKCIEYFSLDNGEKARSSEENYFSFCKSGEEIDGMCSESTLLDQSKLQKGECTKENTCIYKLHNSSTIFIPSKCQCSFSKRGKKFCEIGSSHSDKKSYFKTLKRSLMSGACHTVERRLCEIAQDNFNSVELKKVLHYYNFKAFHEHKFSDSEFTDKCIQKVFYPDYTEIDFQLPTLETCPSFVCQERDIHSQDNNCARLLRNQAKPQIFSYEIIPCKKDSEICPFNTKNMFDLNNLPQKYDCFEYKKSTNNSEVASVERYAGEPCSLDSECRHNMYGKSCLNNVCLGSNFEEKCYSHEDCLSGYYCENMSCVRQKYKGSHCNHEYECRNHLSCYNRKCVPYFSLKEGTQVDGLKVKSTEVINLEELCRFGRIDEMSYKCSKIVSKDEVNPESGLVKCNANQVCNYTSNDVDFTESCLCGYNQIGQGFCPVSHDISINWDLYYSQVRNNRNNACHTLKRFNCDLIPDHLRTLEKDLKLKSVYMPLYYNSSSCIVETMLSVFYVLVDFPKIFLLVIITLF